MEKVTLITGITGQDGAYLAEFLLNKGYIVHGIKRRFSSFNTARIDHLYKDPQERKAMWLMLQQERPDDYVVATDETHSVREFIELTFKELGIEIIWQGKGVEEVGIDAFTGKVIVEVDPGYYRPTEVELLIGDPSKAREKLGWQPKVKMEELVKIMVKYDEEEVLKNYLSEKLSACQELKENIAENPLNLKSL